MAPGDEFWDRVIEDLRTDLASQLTPPWYQAPTWVESPEIWHQAVQEIANLCGEIIE
jgi:hypothetical protein